MVCGKWMYSRGGLAGGGRERRRKGMSLGGKGQRG